MTLPGLIHCVPAPFPRAGVADAGGIATPAATLIKYTPGAMCMLCVTLAATLARIGGFAHCGDNTMHLLGLTLALALNLALALARPGPNRNCAVGCIYTSARLIRWAHPCLILSFE